MKPRKMNSRVNSDRIRVGAMRSPIGPEIQSHYCTIQLRLRRSRSPSRAMCRAAPTRGNRLQTELRARQSAFFAKTKKSSILAVGAGPWRKWMIFYFFVFKQRRLLRPQCVSKDGKVIAASKLRVTPPNAISRRRLWPYMPQTSRSAPQSEA